MIRPQPSPAADKLWAALRRVGNKGLTTTEAANRKLASEPYARRRLALWHTAGYLTREDGLPGMEPHRYFLAADAHRVAPMITASGDVIDRTPAMTPAQFAAIRRRLGVSATEMGRRLGWKGLPNDISRAVRRFETGKKPIDANLAAKVRALR